jgi:hypothetical protein
MQYIKQAVRQMRSLYKRISAVAVMLAGCLAQPAIAGSVTLLDTTWHLLSVPGSPAQNTVEDIFDDALDVSHLSPSGDSTWAVYTFDAEIQRYSRATANTPLGNGQGFWIIQITGDNVEIEMPQPSTGSVATVQDGCATSAGCFAVDLPTDDTSTQWLMTGSPFNWSVAASQLRVKAIPPICGDGCTLEESEQDGYTGNSVFAYDSVSGHYQTIDGDQLVAPWSGFWFDVEPLANGLDPQLLIPDTAATVQVNGIVTEPDGTPAAGVAVKLGDETLTTTSVLGSFSVSLVSNTRHVLQFVSNKHASQVRVVDLPLAGGVINIDVTVLARGMVTNVDSGAAFTVVGPAGASVSNQTFAGIPAFMNEAGELVGGPIELSITVVDVEDPSLLPGFPGAFVGSPHVGLDDLPLVSQGTVEFAFRDLDGNPLQLADENASATGGAQTALIQIPLFSDELPDGSLIAEGKTIPFWSLNEATGIWKQEGIGTVVENLLSPTGLALEATVTHFSWWNSDVSPETGTIQVGVSGPALGTVTVLGGTTSNLGTRLNVSTVTTVGALTDSLYIPADVEVCVYAEVVLDIGPSFSTFTQCVTLEEDENRDILFEFDLLADLIVLEIKSQSGQSQGQSYDIAGNIGSPVEPISVKPLTPETSVEYSGDNLPAGLELISGTDETSVVVKGRPTESGEFSAIITGIDDDGNSASVSLQYAVSSVLLPPDLVTIDSIGLLFVNASNAIESTQFELQQFNRGGLATNWSIEDIILAFDSNSPGPPLSLSDLPAGVELDAVTGVLTVMTPFGDGGELAPPGFEGSATLLGTLRAENRDPLDPSVVRMDTIEIEIRRASYFDGPGGGDGPAN